MDPFTSSWMTDVVDELRKQNLEEGPGRRDAASSRPEGPRRSRAAGTRCSRTPRTSPRPRASRSRGWPGGQALYRAYLLKLERLRDVFKPAAARRRGSGWSRGSPAPAHQVDEVRRLSRRCGATRTPSSGPWSSASPTPGRGHQQDQAHGEDGLRLQELRQPRGAGHAQVLEPPDRASRALDLTHKKPRSLKERPGTHFSRSRPSGPEIRGSAKVSEGPCGARNSPEARRHRPLGHAAEAEGEGRVPQGSAASSSSAGRQAGGSS